MAFRVPECCVAALLACTALPASAVQVPLGGEASEVVADDVRRVFYVTLSTSEVVVVDAMSPRVTARIPVPVPPTTAILDAASDRLYITQGADVGVVDLATGAYTTTVSLTFPRPLSALTLCGSDRLLAADDRRIHFVDRLSLTEVASGEFSSTSNNVRQGIACSADGARMYRLVMGHSVVPLAIYDVVGDALCMTGIAAVGGNFSSCRELASDSNGRLYPGCGSPYFVPILETERAGAVGPAGALLTGAWGSCTAFSPLAGTVHVSSDDEIRTFNATTHSPVSEVPTGRAASIPSLAALADGSVLATLVRDTANDPTLLEVIDPISLGANKGGVRARVLGADTGRVLPATLDDGIITSRAETEFVDERAGLVGIGPLTPGAHTIEIAADGYEPQQFGVTVTGGLWTDLGDVVLMSSGSPEPPNKMHFPDLLVPGMSGRAVLLGRGFREGATVTGSPNVIVHSSTFVDWNELILDISVSPAIPSGSIFSAVTVANPRGQASSGARASVACGPPVNGMPPAEVGMLRLVKTPSSSAPYLFSWDPVILDVFGAPETMGTYELARSETPMVGTSAWQVVSTTQYPWEPTAGEDLPLQYFLVRARDAAGNLGH